MAKPVKLVYQVRYRQRFFGSAEFIDYIKNVIGDHDASVMMAASFRSDHLNETLEGRECTGLLIGSVVPIAKLGLVTK